MIKIGNTGIVGVYKGSTPITSIYKGIDLVYKTGSPIPELQHDIIFEYDTVLGDNNKVYLPIVALHKANGDSGQAVFTVDWGDGQTSYTDVSTYSTLLVSHTYSTAGTYEVRVNMDDGVQYFSISNYPVAGKFPDTAFNSLTKIKSYGDQPTSLYLNDKNFFPNLSYVAPDYYGILTSNNPNTKEQNIIMIKSGADTLQIGPFPKLTGSAPGISTNATTLGNLFGQNDQLTNWSWIIADCPNLVSIDELYCAGATAMVNLIRSCPKLHTIKSMYWGKISDGSRTFYTGNVIRYLTIKNIGENLSEDISASQYNFSNLTLWGQDNEDCPNARQSLIDSLITYSKDLAGSSVPIVLSSNTYSLLTSDELSQIRAKGYSVTSA